MSWKIDPAHSEITFNIRHMMISTVRGSFEKFDGAINFNEQNPTLSTVDIQIDAASINTRDPQRDAHLRSPDFLNTETYPYLTFKSQRIEMLDESHARIYGDLTIRELTRPVVLEVTYNGKVKNPWGQEAAGFSATASLNRKDWNLNWNVALEAGGVLVGDTINVNIELELVKQPEMVAA